MLTALILACAPTAEQPDEAPPPAQPLVIYSGRSESLVGPLFERLEGELGVELQVQYGKTPELVTRLLTEGAESPADLFLAQDSGHLGLLAKQGALAPLPDALLQTVDPRFRDAGGTWVGTSGRLRVLVVDGESVAEEDRPTSLEALADPAWKGKLGWAPTNGSLQTHLSALRHMWGEERTRTWLEGVKANEPRAFPKNSPQVAAANDGGIAIGWVNHYYLHRTEKDGRRALNHSFPEQGKEGNLMMVAGAGVRAGSTRADDAHAVIEALLSESSQTYFAQKTFEYPTRPGIETHADVQPLSEIPLADVAPEHLADLAPTRTLLQELQLL
ncbi:MAG: extracellular solute-binding protein [Myxococcales bacterium]|nr:extracellular solute-binding protein [Myxococcales bacterium]